MKKQNVTLKDIALVKEIESPENPGGLEKRVALTPKDVGKLRAEGLNIFVEYGAGSGVGYADQEYIDNGAVMQSGDDIYRNKDMVIKFKGPALASIPVMQKGCVLFCMAHFHSFPERAKMLEKHEINVVAMEEVLESPKIQTDEQILSRTAMAEALKSAVENNTVNTLKVSIIGFNQRLAGATRRAGNRNPRSLSILQENVAFDSLVGVDENTLFFYDSRSFTGSSELIEKLTPTQAKVFDLHQFGIDHGETAISAYRESHPPLTFGTRRIQCLHETGQAGARYGLQLLRQNKPDLDIREAKVLVLGYGNVARGAINEAYDQGVEKIHILGRTHTSADNIDAWLDGADLIVNGAELPVEVRGHIYLIRNDQLNRVIPEGSVIIDLVGGSASNRSAVEPVISCTFLTEPHFEKEGVTVSALWGWPMLGMMRESAIKYSSQITDILIGNERLVDGIGELHPGVKPALVCGPF